MQLPLAGQWFATEPCADDITLITECHVSPDLACNIWHIRGRDADLLVDTGLGLVSLRAELTMLTGRTTIAVASHTHFDHIGGHHEFDQRLCHPLEAGVLAKPDDHNTVWDAYAPGLAAQQPFRAAPRQPFSMEKYRIEPAPPTRLIDEGDEIDLGNRLLRVFHMPGHSPGSVCLYEAATATLFCGDVLYDGALLDTLYHSDPERYRETLARLKELPGERYHCGHYASFGRAHMHELVDAYQASRGR